MRIILHIGTEKTGTSSIQKFCVDNRELLLSQGVYYPVSPADPVGNHVLLSAYFQDGGWMRHMRRDLEITSPQQLKQFRRQFLFSLSKELSLYPDKTILFSNEHLSMCHEDDEVEKLAGLLRQFTDDIKILVYLRRQMDKHATLHATRVVRGEPGLKLDLNEQELALPNFNYLGMLDRWARFFGKRNIVVRPFEEQQLAGGDVVKDFIDVLGLQGDFVFSQRQNRRPSMECIQFLTHMFEYIPRVQNDTLHPYRRNLGESVMALTGGEPYSCPQLRKLEDRFDESNAEIARKYLGREDGALFSDAPGPDAGEIPPMSVEQAVKIASKLWISQCQSIDKLTDELAACKALVSQLKQRGLVLPESMKKLEEQEQELVLPEQRLT